jgi:hypothetical protein
VVKRLRGARDGSVPFQSELPDTAMSSHTRLFFKADTCSIIGADREEDGELLLKKYGVVSRFFNDTASADTWLEYRR